MKRKECFECREVQPLSEFYRHGQMADGHLNKCKACTRAYMKRHRDESLEKVRAYDRARGCRHGPEYLREYRRRNPEKARAHSLVAYAVRTGKMLKKPCEVCGSGDTHAHHDDYLLVYEVRWLCAKHHRQHREGRSID